MAKVEIVFPIEKNKTRISKWKTDSRIELNKKEFEDWIGLILDGNLMVYWFG
ncbi:hypothetical protein WICANDRAFT_83597 [Wickerhamomyces anomalus NRRL Y-366-8]|uniref:Uncharacterized protein n=1 Tax=Wickerhamomyces anomalus (strain ATCC 58044 / CBS 1984 / NCYC 433 / NRRL Y-366-8) TaxID=683960 RepID=A0A1E3P7U1_WICAA|nr:uncharacterized protein WICANDRAFT_83597 [Wickerhamomyces anomalus NRRL Y-366-8]ODQ61475.1 hypothetical protein WICANDRAFT_83597 [Wickerhamomyces anomalus NRRL Y-366-8]